MQTDRVGALDLAKRVVAAVAQDPVVVNEKLSIKVTVSAGSAAMPTDADSGLALLNAADKALYAAKSRGRNRALSFHSL
jgi:diguanylate cyclase (GGDEF)-like protein